MVRVQARERKWACHWGEGQVEAHGAIDDSGAEEK
jgi:hypothetical protein